MAKTTIERGDCTTIPCYNCKKRAVGCHSTCEEYTKFRTEKDSLKQKIRDESIADAYTVNRQAKIFDRIAEREKKDRRCKRK